MLTVNSRTRTEIGGGSHTLSGAAGSVRCARVRTALQEQCSSAALVFLAVALIFPANVHAQECLHTSNESSDQQARRQAAVEYLTQLNLAQMKSHQDRGRFLALNETPRADSIPVGFVVRLVVDQWSYLVSLQDFFDPCGFTLFTSDRGVIYGAYPTSVGRMIPAESTPSVEAAPAPKRLP